MNVWENGGGGQEPCSAVATPGRLLHHVEEIDGFSIRSVTHVVLDEAGPKRGEGGDGGDGFLFFF